MNRTLPASVCLLAVMAMGPACSRQAPARTTSCSKKSSSSREGCCSCKAASQRSSSAPCATARPPSSALAKPPMDRANRPTGTRCCASARLPRHLPDKSCGLAADGTVKLTDRLQDRIGWNVTIPSRDGHPIRLIDLATHSSGLPRELDRSRVRPTIRSRRSRRKPIATD